MWRRVRTSLGCLPRHRSRVGVEGRAQRTHRVEESRSNGADGNAERLGDLDERKVEVVVQHDDGAVINRQPAECTLQLVAVSDGRDVIGSDVSSK